MAGFIDGDGCFTILISGGCLIVCFSIVQVATRKELISALAAFLKVKPATREVSDSVIYRVALTDIVRLAKLIDY